MGFSAAALAFGYGHQWQEMFRILEATLLQIFFWEFGTPTVCFFFPYLRPERRMKLPYHHFPGGNHLLTQLDFKSARFESLMKDAS